MKTDKATLAEIHPLAWDVVTHLIRVGYVADEELEPTLDAMARHGMDGGVAGFVYDSDCVAFLRRTDVLEKARMVMRDYADGIGEPLWRVAARTVCTAPMTDQQIDSDQVVQINGARLLAWDVGMLTTRDFQWLAARLVWFAVVRVAYAFEDADGYVDWRSGDPGEPERGSDGHGDMEGATDE